MTNNCLSYHIFLFPFRWDCIGESFENSVYEIDIEKRLQISHFDKILKGSWKFDKFKIDEAKDYNEFVFFYDYVRDAIYNTEPIDKNQTAYYYKYLVNALTDKYVINIEKEKISMKFELCVDSISLKLFDTGIGILGFHLENLSYDDPNDILLINEFGRRIYPQYLVENFEIKAESYGAQGTFLAKSIELQLDRQEPLIEDFLRYTKKDHLIVEKNQSPVYLPKFIDGLFNCNGKEYVTTNFNDSHHKILINPIIDDRMFVLSAYMNSSIPPLLKHFDINANEYAYITDDYWYKYVFVDTEQKTCQSKVMSKELIQKATYDRWIESGTLYGLSRYSFMAMMSHGTFSKDVLMNHVKTMYYQMVVLCLAQRASILRFSDEVTYISTLTKSSTNNISNLYKKYIQFVNKIYFREITSQEQGIELYQKLQEQMNLPRDIKDLDGEIGELHNYADLKEDKKTNDLVTFLTVISVIFLIPTLIMGYYGMNSIDDIVQLKSLYSFWEMTILFTILPFILIFIYTLVREYRRRNK